MRLYVCYGTFKWGPRKGGHPCGRAYHALRDAGHDPEVIRARGFGALPDAVNGKHRREVKRLTGNAWVPALVLDDGTVVDGAAAIVEWAAEHPVAA
ncbi:MAG: glutathione S-transferase N-terminal domain-containing protein [Solirubrobacteraceae bacterium]